MGSPFAHTLYAAHRAYATGKQPGCHLLPTHFLFTENQPPESLENSTPSRKLSP